MNVFVELRELGVTLRPLGGESVQAGGQWSLFRADVSSTLELLERELRLLEAEHAVLQLEYRERDLRLDGLPRADARLNGPGVILSFVSKYGPLRYATGEYDEWEDNLRAIALSMEALRAVDRYGVSKRGEQYRGWKALPASTDPADAVATPEQARAILDEYGGETAAIKATHPDAGGDPDEFRKVQRAREILAA